MATLNLSHILTNEDGYILTDDEGYVLVVGPADEIFPVEYEHTPGSHLTYSWSPTQ